MSSFSSPVKQGAPPPETLNAKRAMEDARDRRIACEIDSDTFLKTYLDYRREDNQPTWSQDQQVLINEIENTQLGNEVHLYTGAAPLLRLLNSISLQVAGLAGEDDSAPALVFCDHHNKQIFNTMTRRQLSPDIVVLHSNRETLKRLVAANAPFLAESPVTWSNIVAVGEVKVNTDPRHQLSNYVVNHLQFHPELSAVLGFAARSSGYQFIYHDASAVHRSPRFTWQPGPIYAFIAQLYAEPFHDPSQRVLPSRIYVTNIQGNIFVSECPRIESGPGQRRFTSLAIHAVTAAVWFIKEFWRDMRRRYFEGSLYKLAHQGQHLPGLMDAEDCGHVLDVDGKKIETTVLEPGPGGKPAVKRYKMRVLTPDVGRPLEDIHCLGQFLRVMYDACVVQRNLYRKCKILHRDISDNNVMIAPDDPKFHERCAGGYDQVKYINQVLAGDKNVQPKPACLVIDLGNGAIVEPYQGDPEVLAERTGTPKFIARSVSSGKTLAFRQHRGELSQIPRLQGRALEVYQSFHKEQYESFNESFDKSSCPTSDPGVRFTHHLFHDAESMFWIMAWLLARSVGPNYQPEKEWTQEFTTFISALAKHYPSQNQVDSRIALDPSLRSWSRILHPDLSRVADMVSKMHEYIEPEWAYRTGLDDEHAHEALMRLLLTEIVWLQDHPETDISLVVGGRSLPTRIDSRRSSQKSHTTNSILSVTDPSQSSRNTSLPGSQLLGSPITVPSLSQDPQHQRSKKRSSSQLGGDEESSSRSRGGPRLSVCMPHRDEALAEARAIKWSATMHSLEPLQCVTSLISS